MKKQMFIIVMCVIVLSLSSAVKGDVDLLFEDAPGITILNPSFEKADHYEMETPDWFDYTDGAFQESFGDEFPTPYGNVWGVLEYSDSMHWQPIGTWTPDVDYVIRVVTGKRPGWDDGQTKVALWAGGEVPLDWETGRTTTPSQVGATLIDAHVFPQITEDGAYRDNSVIINTGTAHNAGDPLFIAFTRAGNSGRAHFDMVRVNLPAESQSEEINLSFGVFVKGELLWSDEMQDTGPWNASAGCNISVVAEGIQVNTWACSPQDVYSWINRETDVLIASGAEYVAFFTGRNFRGTRTHTFQLGYYEGSEFVVLESSAVPFTGTTADYEVILIADDHPAAVGKTLAVGFDGNPGGYVNVAIGTVEVFSGESFENDNDGDELSLTIDLQDEKQTIKAFGASDAWSIQFIGQWPDAKRNAIADLLFSKELDEDNNPRGIALSSWRFYVGAGSTRDTNPQTRISDQWRRADTFLNTTYDGYDWTRLAAQRWFAQAAKARGVESFTLFTKSPPVNMTKNGLAYPYSGQYNLPEEHVEDFAEYLAEILEGLHDHYGMEFDFVSPFNEPQWGWDGGSQEGWPYDNTRMSQVVKALYDEIQTRNINTQIMIAEAGSIDYLYGNISHRAGNQIHQFFNPSSPIYIGGKLAPIITGHSYWADTARWDLVSKRLSLKNRLDEYPGLSYAMTEYCILGNDGSGYELRGDGRDLGIDPALRLARTIHYDMTMTDAILWDWWLAVSPYNYKDGLVYTDHNTSDGNYYDSKMLWGMGNFSRFVRPGMQRIGVARSDNAGPDDTLYGLMVSAYKNEAAGEVVLVFVNWLDQLRTVSLNIQSQNSSNVVHRWLPYVTSATHNLAAQAEVTSDAVEIPARSIVTLVGSPEASFGPDDLMAFANMWLNCGLYPETHCF